MRDIDKDRALCAAENIGIKIRNLIKYMDEHDQPYEDIFEEITKLVRKQHDEFVSALPYWMDQYERVQQERDEYWYAAKNERELSNSIVAEREELIIENERLKQRVSLLENALQRASNRLLKLSNITSKMLKNLKENNLAN